MVHRLFERLAIWLVVCLVAAIVRADCEIPASITGTEAQHAYALGRLSARLEGLDASVEELTIENKRLLRVVIRLRDMDQRPLVVGALRPECPEAELVLKGRERDQRQQDTRWRSWVRWLRPREGAPSVLLPDGVLFQPPLADQKQPRFHVTYQRYETEFGRFNVGSVGFGENLGLVRWPAQRVGDGWQLGINGAVFAIFNLDAESLDLLNADYFIGFPLEFRSGATSARLRVFHLSSHLGDEFLLNPQPGPPVERINLSYEALEGLASWERRGFRVYGGGVRIFSSDTPLARWRGQLGLEYRSRHLGDNRLRVLAGADIQSWQETDWDVDVSLKAGLLIPNPRRLSRSIQLLIEYYDGHAPHGQFYPLEVRYFGWGVAFAL
ncbi:MAG: DUF1207 domain-containing protein [Acidobacteriota bacterium]|nr:MAG: DUF1207 domain-containing protein [Acidobacteriota bacterium]